MKLKQMNKIRKSINGFTLVELVIVMGILAFVITGMVRLYIYTSVQAEMAGNKTQALSEAQNIIEEIRRHTYSLITTDYASGGTPGNTFSVSPLTGSGVIYIDSSNAELLQVKAVVCWRNKYNRVIGEDQDLDGTLDAGEDQNGNGQIDSPVSLITLITRK